MLLGRLGVLERGREAVLEDVPNRLAVKRRAEVR